MAMDPAVKAYAQMMLNDHSNLATQVRVAAARADSQYVLPKGVGADGQLRLDALRSSGHKFDSLYKAQMITGHSAAQSLFQNYVGSGTPNLEVRAVISGALPTIAKHLAEARALPDT